MKEDDIRSVIGKAALGAYGGLLIFILLAQGPLESKVAPIIVLPLFAHWTYSFITKKDMNAGAYTVKASWPFEVRLIHFLFSLYITWHLASDFSM
jgi:hypothetical protein